MNLLIICILYSGLILLTAHLFLLPLLQRRPAFIKGFEGSLLITVLLAILATYTYSFIYLIAVAIGIIIYYTKSWLVIGVSVANINLALDKAILATRSVSKKLDNYYQINNNMQLRIINLGLKISLILYKSKQFSQKDVLTKNIFRKFIQNYFI